jgi:hypothetical protein
MAALSSSEIASRWVASSSVDRSYSGLTISYKQTIALCLSTANKGVKNAYDAGKNPTS